MTRYGVHTLVALLFLAALLTRPASGLSSPGPTGSAALAAATEQVDRGKAVFANHCAKCHGASGQGDDGPRLIGTPNGLAGFQTAQKLFEFVSVEMPYDSPGSLKPEEVWDVLAFILDSNSLLPPNTILGPENAANIRLSR